MEQLQEAKKCDGRMSHFQQLRIKFYAHCFTTASITAKNFLDSSLIKFRDATLGKFTTSSSRQIRSHFREIVKSMATEAYQGWQKIASNPILPIKRKSATD